MDFISTRDPLGRRFSLAEALRLGPAPDGGLFMPARIEVLPDAFWARLEDLALIDIARAVLGALLGEALTSAQLESLVEEAFDFPLPLVTLRPDLRVLELFHGPTLAFKDVGARVLARLLPLAGNQDQDALVLVATSGDTGGAVAQAFFGVPGTRVVILYPQGAVSPHQERQFTTLGGNVQAFAVDGTFDDCQSLVKRAFADRELAKSLGLTSANSINIGRLLPQAVYYVHAAAQLGAQERRRPLIFSTPSGNFGNLTAGFLAARLGLDCRFVAATNANDVVPEYLEKGVYRPRPSVRTLSNAMDVGQPNNFERIESLFDHDLAALRAKLQGERVSDDETRATIARVFRDFDYLLDPHTAVGLVALERVLGLATDEPLGIVLATAHPAKFRESVEPVIGAPLPLPEALARHLEKPNLAEDLPNDWTTLQARLRALK
jgi:threonine synthase